MSANQEQDEHLRTMMRAGIEKAFMERIGKLFDMWVVDSAGQPERAANGTRKAIAIYRQAIEIIETAEL